MSLLAVCTEHPADLHRSFYVISDCHQIQKNWALFAPQNGAHSRGAFRDFHSIPKPINLYSVEHLSVVTTNSKLVHKEIFAEKSG